MESDVTLRHRRWRREARQREHRPSLLRLPALALRLSSSLLPSFYSSLLCISPRGPPSFPATMAASRTRRRGTGTAAPATTRTDLGSWNRGPSPSATATPARRSSKAGTASPTGRSMAEISCDGGGSPPSVVSPALILYVSSIASGTPT